MKILINNVMYIQKVDLEYLKYYYRTLPDNISKKIFENPEIDIDDYSKYDFFEFTNPQDIEYFQSVNLILDYNTIENYSTKELIELGKSYLEEYEEVAKKLYSTAKKDKEYATMLSQYKALNYKMRSLDDFLDFKGGRLNINLPLPTKKLTVKKIINKILPKKS